MLDNQIHLGDCLDILPKITTESVDLVIADPPYGNVVKEKWDKTTLEPYKQFSEAWLKECHRILKPTGSIYVWCSFGDITVKYWLIMADLVSDIFKLKNMIVWSKQRGRGNVRGWLFTREEILWGVKHPKNYFWNKEGQYSTIKYHDAWIKRLGKEDNPYKRCTNVWTDIDEVTIEQAKTSGGKGERKTLHPTQKPVTAIERLIKCHTIENDLVVDPFGGSGTTAVAAKNLNRRFIVIEKDPTYYQTSVDRLNKC